MKLLFLIATCERPGMLRKLLWQISSQCSAPYHICVVDDASEKDYSAVRSFLQADNHTYLKLDTRNGKKGYYRTVSTLFQQAKGQEFDVVYKLDDDVQLHPQAIGNSLEMFQVINNYARKVMLNLWVDHRAEEAVWTGIPARRVRFGGIDLRRVGWIDGGNWMTHRRVLEVLDWECPQPPEKWWRSSGDSSGVGKYLSIELARKACRVYMPPESLVYHGGHDSVMHPDKVDRPIEMQTKPWE